MQQPLTTDSLWFMDGHVTVRLSGAANAAGISITEHLMPSGFGPPLHVHRDEDETFYILEGEFRTRLGAVTGHAGPGDLVHLPRGVPHGFRVLSPGGGRCLIVSTGGFEAMLRSASRPAPSATLPPPEVPTAQMLARLAEICAANGIDLLGPPID